MAAPGIPVDLRVVMSLPALGIPAEAINFRNVSMDSDKAMCVRMEVGEAKSVQIVSLATGTITNKFPMAAESAVLSPDGKSIAVRAGTALQVYNLELQKKIKSFKLPDTEAVQYWTWISSNTIAIVTVNSAYHWAADGDSAPVKVFDRAPNLAGTQVISYAASPDSQWLMVVGIKPSATPGGAAEGAMQLYSVEKKVSQPLTAHAGCFHVTKLPGRSDSAILFCFVDLKPGAAPKLMIIEVGKDRSAPGGTFRLAPQDLPVPADATAGGDFPVSIEASKKHDVLYILTKMGYAYLYDIPSGGVIFRHRISETPVFTSTLHEASGGVLAVTARTGQVLLLTLNTDNVVGYVTNVLRNQALAMSLAGRLGLGGADELYVGEFNRLLSAGDIDGAAKCAANSPNGILRTQATIQRFQQVPAPEGGQPPVLKYFSLLMESGKLNKAESLELARPALQQGRVQLVEKWLAEDKVTCSEGLGDMVMPINQKLALSIYAKAGDAHEKVVQCLLAMGDFGKIVPYCAKFGYKPNFVFILQNLVHSNPKAAQEFGTQLVKAEGGPLIDTVTVVDIFMQFQRLQECTAFLLEVLAADKAEEGFLQTRLLEMNLQGGAPQVVNAILGSGMFHHFDRARIALLCEKYQLPQRALELYSDLKDIKRVLLMSAAALDPAFVMTYFGTLTAENVLEVLAELLKNPVNEALVVKAATQFSDQLGPEELIKTFEAAKSVNGLFYYLGAIVNTSENKAVHFKYIVSAANLKQYKEVERVARDSTIYDPAAVKEFLMDAKLPDPRPLIHVCDRFGFTEELTQYLYSNKLAKFIEVYVQKVAPAKTPLVVGKLLDLDADEDFIKATLASVGMLCPVQPLVEECEKRNRLRLLQPFLEARVSEGTQDVAVHNAVGKIYITLNKDPQNWLKTNTYYDSRVIGKYCEKLDPFLAYLAYKRANGACDAELIDVTSNNGLFKDQARYLVERQDLALWDKVLQDDNPHRRDLIDQVTGTALPETKNPDEVSTTVKAFMTAKLPNELIGLLEKLVLGNGDFHTNRNLQNLLILTAIRCAHEPAAPPGRAMDYINRLDNFDGKEIAKIALRDEYQLFEEAFTIYKKFQHHLEAVGVLLEKINDIDRASEYATRVNDKEVWSLLAKAQLDAGLAKDAIDSYIKAADTSNYPAVISTAEAAGKFDDLVRFLEMARKTLKEKAIDSALVYALAQTHRMTELEQFVSSPNVADIQGMGDRAFEEGLFEAARILFTAISNNAKLASTLVAMALYREAVDAAKKANSLRTWKEVNAACVKAGEFKLAQVCGLNIIVSPDHLEELIHYYEEAGHWEELVKLLEQGVGLENAHAGIFTELGVMYSRYRPESLMAHIKVFHARMNASKILRACEAGRHWEESTFMHIATEDFDQAIKTMIDHSPVAFKTELFFESIPKVRNAELHYSAINFYLEEEPAQLSKLLSVLTPKLDHSRVVHQLRKAPVPDALQLVLPYLRAVQKENLTAVNEAVNQILVEDEDVDGLRASIAEHDSFDQVALAQRLEKHELLELRRVSALLYKRNKRWEQSIALSKQDAQVKDAVDTAAESGDSALAEGLLSFFLGKGDKSSFGATLFTCYKLVRPDVALELAWRHRAVDFVMPFVIQFLRDTTHKIAELERRTKPKEGEDAGSHEAAAAAGVHLGGGLPPFGTGVLAIADVAYNQNYPGQGGLPPPGPYGGGLPPPGAYGGGLPPPGYGAPPPGYGGGLPPPGYGGGLPPPGYGGGMY